MHRAVLGLTLLLAACSSPDDGGADATRRMVLETCAPGGAAVETRVCECAFETLSERFDADELERLDGQLRDDPETVPDEVQAAVLDCEFELIAPPTTPTTSTTSTTRRPTTSSTSSTSSTSTTPSSSSSTTRP